MSKSSYAKLAADAGDQYLATLAEGQETFLKSISAFTAWAPSAPTVAFPTAQEISEASFAFAQKLLKQQKDFSEKLFSATVPASN